MKKKNLQEEDDTQKSWEGEEDFLSNLTQSRISLHQL